MGLTWEQLLLAFATIAVFPAALYLFKRYITKRDKEANKARKAEEEALLGKLDVMNTKLDNSEKNMLEFRNDIRKDILTLHERVSEHKAADETAHGEIWKEVNASRERIKGLETAHNILHPECQLSKEDDNG